MPPPPPPPPPAACALFGKATKANNNVKSASDRNALLSQIRKGAALKRVETNDRSLPLLQSGNKAPSCGGGTTTSKANGPFIPPGGLFAQGMPKLRSTCPKGGDSCERPSFAQAQNTQPSENSITPDGFSALNQNAVGLSRSQPPSPLMKARQTCGVNRSQTSAGNRNFPSDLNIKGPAPAPPPSSQKPNFGNQNACVRRSLSQTGIGPKMRLARPPPNVKPPPPPKNTTALQNTGQSMPPPPPPSKPPDVRRRQSFGVADASLVVNYNGFQLCRKSLVPPPPPRNNSMPNNLDHIPNNSPASVHVNKMTTAPPPPPCRPGIGSTRAPLMRPPPPPPSRAPAPPALPPHRFPVHPAPPSQLKAMPSSTAAAPPPPPTRVSSVMSSHSTESISDFEARFYHKFQSVQNLPAPDKFRNVQKVYPSKTIRERSTSIRRNPPPPPPLNIHAPNLSRGSTPTRQPLLHIQLESRVFANNTAHC